MRFPFIYIYYHSKTAAGTNSYIYIFYHYHRQQWLHYLLFVISPLRHLYFPVFVVQCYLFDQFNSSIGILFYPYLTDRFSTSKHSRVILYFYRSSFISKCWIYYMIYLQYSNRFLLCPYSFVQTFYNHYNCISDITSIPTVSNIR